MLKMDNVDEIANAPNYLHKKFKKPSYTQPIKPITESTNTIPSATNQINHVENTHRTNQNHDRNDQNSQNNVSSIISPQPLAKQLDSTQMTRVSPQPVSSVFISSSPKTLPSAYGYYHPQPLTDLTFSSTSPNPTNRNVPSISSSTSHPQSSYYVTIDPKLPTLNHSYYISRNDDHNPQTTYVCRPENVHVVDYTIRGADRSLPISEVTPDVHERISERIDRGTERIERISEQRSKRMIDRGTERSIERISERIVDRGSERGIERISDRGTERFPERFQDHFPERVSERMDHDGEFPSNSFNSTNVTFSEPTRPDIKYYVQKSHANHQNSGTNVQSSSASISDGEAKKSDTSGKYVCSYCNLSCTKPSVLQKHIRAHTNERPYPCHSCGFSFKTKSNLYKHCRSRSHANRTKDAPPLEDGELDRLESAEASRFDSIADDRSDLGDSKELMDSQDLQPQDCTIGKPYKPKFKLIQSHQNESQNDESVNNTQNNTELRNPSNLTVPMTNLSIKIPSPTFTTSFTRSAVSAGVPSGVSGAISGGILVTANSLDVATTSTRQNAMLSPAVTSAIKQNPLLTSGNAAVKQPIKPLPNTDLLKQHINDLITKNQSILDVNEPSFIKKRFLQHQLEVENNRKNGQVNGQSDEPLNLSASHRKRCMSETLEIPSSSKRSLIKELLLKNLSQEQSYVCQFCKISFKNIENFETHRKKYCKVGETPTSKDMAFVRCHSVNVATLLTQKYSKNDPSPTKFIRSNQLPLQSPGPFLGKTSLVNDKPNQVFYENKNPTKLYSGQTKTDNQRNFPSIKQIVLSQQNSFDDLHTNFAKIVLKKPTDVAKVDASQESKESKESNVPPTSNLFGVVMQKCAFDERGSNNLPFSTANKPDMVIKSGLQSGGTILRNNTHTSVSSRLIASGNYNLMNCSTSTSQSETNSTCAMSTSTESTPIDLNYKSQMFAPNVKPPNLTIPGLPVPNKIFTSRYFDHEKNNVIHSTQAQTLIRFDSKLARESNSSQSYATSKLQDPLSILVNGKLVRYVPGMPGPESGNPIVGLSSIGLSSDVKCDASDDKLRELKSFRINSESSKTKSLSESSKTTSPIASTTTATSTTVAPSDKPKFLRPTSLALKPSQKGHHGLTPNVFNQALISPDTPRVAKKYCQLYLNGNCFTYLGLKSSTKSTYCTLNKTQPNYVESFGKISMYSQWRHLECKSDMSRMDTYDSRQRQSNYATAGKLNSTSNCNVVDSSYKFTKSTETVTASAIKMSVQSDTDQTDKLNANLTNNPSDKQKKTDTLLDEHCVYDENTGEAEYVRGRGRGKYKCRQCGIRCKKPSMLKKHLRTHLDIRPFSCNYCNFSFKTKGNLTKHMKSKGHYKRINGISNGTETIEGESGESNEGTQQTNDIQMSDDDDAISEGSPSQGVSEEYSENDDSGVESNSHVIQQRLQDHEAAHCLLSLSQNTEPVNHAKSQDELRSPLVDKNPLTYPYQNVVEPKHHALQQKPNEMISTLRNNLGHDFNQVVLGAKVVEINNMSNYHEAILTETDVALASYRQKFVHDQSPMSPPVALISPVVAVPTNSTPLSPIVAAVVPNNYLNSISKPFAASYDREFSVVSGKRVYSDSVGANVNAKRKKVDGEFGHERFIGCDDSAMDLSVKPKEMKVTTSADVKLTIKQRLLSNQINSLRSADSQFKTKANHVDHVQNEQNSFRPIILHQRSPERNFNKDMPSNERLSTPTNKIVQIANDATKDGGYYERNERQVDRFERNDQTRNVDSSNCDSSNDYEPLNNNHIKNDMAYESDNSAMHTLADVAIKRVENTKLAQSVATEYLKLASKNEQQETTPVGGTNGNVALSDLISDDENRSCTICSKNFSKPSQLRLHMNIHYLERPYRCDSCSVSFRTRGHLQKHERSNAHHSKLMTSPSSNVAEPRPFKCTDCNVAFRIHGHLAKHLRSKMHIMKLECLARVPFGLYAELERVSNLLTEINTADCDRCLDSLKILANKLFNGDTNTSHYSNDHHTSNQQIVAAAP